MRKLKQAVKVLEPVDVEPWDQQPHETGPAYAAFCHYRDMPLAGRSLAKAAEQLGKHVSQLHAWSSEWGWVARVRHWDKHMADEQQRILLDAQKEALDMHNRLAQTLLNRVGQRLAGTTEVQKLDASKLSASEIARFVEVAVRIQRQALGIPEPTGREVASEQAEDRSGTARTLAEVLPGDEREWAKALDALLP
jgi:hypothetical protein